MNGLSSAEATILQSLILMQADLREVKRQLADLRQLVGLNEQFAQLRDSIAEIVVQKDFYSTREVADLMGVTQHTVQVRWCAEGRIEAEKDPATGHWRIPGHEYERLRRGGKPWAADAGS